MHTAPLLNRTPRSPPSVGDNGYQPRTERQRATLPARNPTYEAGSSRPPTCDRESANDRRYRPSDVHRFQLDRETSPVNLRRRTRCLPPTMTRGDGAGFGLLGDCGAIWGAPEITAPHLRVSV